MYKSDPPQCCYYISIFANIWYLIKLIHSIIIILRVFMFYLGKGRKDSAICASRKRSGACYSAERTKWAINSLFMPTALSFRPQKSAKKQMLAKIELLYQNWGGPDLYISANTCGRVPSRALSHKSTYTFSVFHYLARTSDPPQCCIISVCLPDCYSAEHTKWAINSLFMPTALSFRPQKSAKTRCI